MTNENKDYTEIWSNKNPKRGDHIRVSRGVYNHHGIYISNDEVIHFSSKDDDNIFGTNNKVIKTSLEEFSRNGIIEVKLYTEVEIKELFNPDLIVNRARAFLNYQGYNLLYNNCEHFANTCTLGRHMSNQIETMIGGEVMKNMKDIWEKLFPDKSKKIIEENLEKYSENKQGIGELLIQILTDSKAYDSADEINKTAKEINETIDSFDAGYHEIQNYKSKGLSSAIWLRDELEKGINHLEQKDKDDVIHSVKEAMDLNNEKLLKAVTINDESNSSLVEKLVSTKFDDLNKTAIANNLKEEIKANTLLGAIEFDGIIPKIDTEHKEIKAVKEYFQNQLDCKSDSDFKKTVTASVEVAKKKGFFPDIISSKPTSQIAAIVDNGLTTVKVAYKVANGEFRPTDAADYLIDRSTSRVKTIIVKTCQKTGEKIGATLGGAIGSLFGPEGTAFGAAVGGFVGSVGGYIVGKLITDGLGTIVNTAKSAIRTCYEGAKSFVSSAVSTVAGWFGF